MYLRTHDETNDPKSPHINRTAIHGMYCDFSLAILSLSKITKWTKKTRKQSDIRDRDRHKKKIGLMKQKKMDGRLDQQVVLSIPPSTLISPLILVPCTLVSPSIQSTPHL